MPEFCSCGAKLPEDARFCHKCGKPQREEFIEAEEAAPEPPPLPAAPPPPEFPPIGFHNRLAVRVALTSGILAFLVSILLGRVLPQAMSLVWLMGAGFLAVFLYRKRTGQRLTVLHGAHLGWICGVFGFVIATILLTGVILLLSDPDVVNSLREQLESTQGQGADLDQILDLMHNPSGIATMLLLTFFSFTVLPAFGGALGAKLLDRD